MSETMTKSERILIKKIEDIGVYYSQRLGEISQSIRKVEEDISFLKKLYGDSQTRLQKLEHPNLDPVLKAFQKLRDSVE